MNTQSNRTARQAARFMIVGLLNTAFGYGIYAASLLTGLVPELALLITFATAMIFNFMTTGRLVFRSTGIRRFPKFAFAYLLIYGINVFALRGVLDLGFRPLIAQLIVLPPIVTCTFVIMKLFVFRSSHAQDY
jgi:putative flippase GtrA